MKVERTDPCGRRKWWLRCAVHLPRIEWDFRLKWVKSINVSGHKYGLVYPGVGWVIWRSKQELPEELVFHINYLGTDQPTFTLNFSKGTEDTSRSLSLSITSQGNGSFGNEK